MKQVKIIFGDGAVAYFSHMDDNYPVVVFNPVTVQEVLPEDIRAIEERFPEAKVEVVEINDTISWHKALSIYYGDIPGDEG